ncbi:glycine cleavage system protein GcvH [Alkalilimnicola sp. S0819]|uniref:glycine cleavage system protein GcvH n=1 Tax=Alkalilimnicola sp. S0819 TaxID=2613922 RepID=UPI001261B4B6|nr:glycine cleavage system protein GcvH [Alkalilimnicola sp. S0819]KAB7628212.1 glycine cleavage system protein GcvH [Alkalilimnicola sp. S0819]MPQ15103.1 glycine cleavage system protein GcvH [Alkalilimnicola sp. S0819]
MSEVPGDLRYAPTHEWLRLEDDGTVLVGITDHAQQALGDLVFVETPEVGKEVEAGEACAVVESVKAASDIYAPVAGEIIDTNGGLIEAPERVNDAPYGDGWIMRIQPSDADQIEELLDADGYEAAIADDDEE